ncbi:MAG: hypothetical protein RBR68_13730 [Tenuifilaceae bacterium]|nr:hypothetical protein [Tenuifilaceae bacterium]
MKTTKYQIMYDTINELGPISMTKLANVLDRKISKCKADIQNARAKGLKILASGHRGNLKYYTEGTELETRRISLPENRGRLKPRRQAPEVTPDAPELTCALADRAYMLIKTVSRCSIPLLEEAFDLSTDEVFDLLSKVYKKHGIRITMSV